MAKKEEKENGDPKRTKLPSGHITRAKELRNIRYAFTPEELANKSRQLANTCEERSNVVAEKKSVMSDFKSKIDAKDAVVSLLSGHICNGYEMKNVECDVIKDFEKGTKTYTHNGVEYETVALTSSDRQTELNLINRSPAASEKDSQALEQELDEEKEETEKEED